MKNIFLAQGYNPIAPGLRVPASGDALTLPRISDILIVIGNYMVTFGIILAVIMIVWGGITYMMASDKTENAKKRIYNGIIGAAVVLGVGLIIKTVASVITGTFFCTGLFC